MRLYMPSLRPTRLTSLLRSQIRRRHCRCIAERLSEQSASFHHPGTNQFFTKRPLARRLYEITKVKIAEHQIAFDCWLEPAAGEGAFFDLLPAANRLGIEIETRNV
jgi:hypothetical protein